VDSSSNIDATMMACLNIIAEQKPSWAATICKYRRSCGCAWS